LQILLLPQHVSGTTMPIIRSSRVLYSACCLWYFVLWFSSCWSGVELRIMCPVCRILQHPANRTHNVGTHLTFERQILCALYRVSQEEWTKLREIVPYVKIYRYNPKHLCPKLNGYGDKGQRKVWSFCSSTYCT